MTEVDTIIERERRYRVMLVILSIGVVVFITLMNGCAAVLAVMSKEPIEHVGVTTTTEVHEDYFWTEIPPPPRADFTRPGFTRCWKHRDGGVWCLYNGPCP